MRPSHFSANDLDINMNRPDQFWRSINVLATAYLQGELKPMAPCACAVGNLIAAEMDGAEVGGELKFWPEHASSPSGKWSSAALFNQSWSLRRAVKVIDYAPSELVATKKYHGHLLPVTQYSITSWAGDPATVLPYGRAEIFRIELALLSVSQDAEDPVFEGLMRVVDVLCNIHEVEDEDLRAEAKQSFEGDYNTVEAVLA